MNMNRERLIQKLAELAGPLGPMGSVSARRADQERWADAGGEALVEELVGLLSAEPLEEVFGTAIADDVEVVVVEVLVRIAERDPERARSWLAPMLAVPLARGVAIEVLGAAGGKPAVALLARLRRDVALDGATRVRLAGALGEIGGDDARGELHALRAATGVDEREVLREIEIAHELAGGRSMS